MGVALRADSLTVEFGGLVAVLDLGFELREGEILGLIGPNGAGKTTVFNAVSGFVRPARGRVSLFGRDVTRLPPWEMARLGVSRTFQVVRPFPRLTVLGNVLVGAHLRHRTRAAAERAAREVVERVGLEGSLHAPASSLTLPSRKRLELARALAIEPRVLLLDEVVAGLNPAEVGEMIALVRGIRASGVSVVIVEHIMKVVMGLSDRVVVLSFGRKIAEGSPDAVAADPEVISAYLGSAA
jgi:branched-chain amino acid transport system ATP-binding protein